MYTNLMSEDVHARTSKSGSEIYIFSQYPTGIPEFKV
jgi:hypothetical protein